MKFKTARRRGQGLAEYIIIVALIAVAAIGVVTLFGNNIRQLFGASAQALAGKEIENPADGRQHDELRKKTLESFGHNNAPH